MLWTIILIIALIIVAFLLVGLLLKRKKHTQIRSAYRKTERVMNESEQELFTNLQNTLGDGYTVLTNARLEDFVEINEQVVAENEKMTDLRNRIKSHYADFLICDRFSTKPLLAIELDDKSHYDAERQERDKYIDDLYKTIDLPIKHFPVGGNSLEFAQSLPKILEKAYPVA